MSVLVAHPFLKRRNISRYYSRYIHVGIYTDYLLTKNASNSETSSTETEEIKWYAMKPWVGQFIANCFMMHSGCSAHRANLKRTRWTERAGSNGKTTRGTKGTSSATSATGAVCTWTLAGNAPMPVAGIAAPNMARALYITPASVTLTTESGFMCVIHSLCGNRTVAAGFYYRYYISI